MLSILLSIAMQQFIHIIYYAAWYNETHGKTFVQSVHWLSVLLSNLCAHESNLLSNMRFSLFTHFA